MRQHHRFDLWANKVKGLLAIGAIVGTCYSFVFVRFLGDTVAIFIFDNKIGVYWQYAHLRRTCFPPDYYLSPILICDNKAGVIQFASARVTVCFWQNQLTLSPPVVKLVAPTLFSSKPGEMGVNNNKSTTSDATYGCGKIYIERHIVALTLMKLQQMGEKLPMKLEKECVCK